MQATFHSLVDQIRGLSFEEKEEMLFLINKYLIEERREQMYQNYQLSIKEVREGMIQFSSDADTLKNLIDE